MIEITFIPEFKITREDSLACNNLIQASFPEIDFQGRDYFKQPPHYRILAKENNKLIGQVGLDYRAMSLDGSPIKVLGLIDICVDSQQRNRKIGVNILQKVDELSLEFSEKIDFIFLVTNIPNYFSKYGFEKIEPTTTWLKIHQHKNYGLGTEKINDTNFMIKPINDKKWEGENLDLLGYMY
jgi:N-acetylglutamate synthase-like GNAT family acetyltransferase